MLPPRFGVGSAYVVEAASLPTGETVGFNKIKLQNSSPQWFGVGSAYVVEAASLPNGETHLHNQKIRKHKKLK